mmetsp:Transcript_145832/g.257233  ORF Transcript_145832/g.257233 Transcript_145832/m.257233 type:complete len:150 (-) Transcript_145832:93-542(-)
MLRLATKQLFVRSATPAVPRVSAPAAFIHTLSSGEYKMAFVSNPVRQEVFAEKPSQAVSLTVEDSEFPNRWWEQDEIKTKLAEWGVVSLTPPASDDIRHSMSTGLLKYGPVTLHVPSKVMIDNVTTNMTFWNRSQGMHQAFKVESNLSA